MAPIIEGSGLGRPLQNAGAPVAGTDEVQTLTIGGTPTGGTFELSFDGLRTGPITWNATNATLLAALDAALEAMANIGTGGVVCAAGTLTAGIGTITITFSGGNVGKRDVSALVVLRNDLTGTTPTVAVAVTTPGVNATGLSAPKGALMTDTTNGILYINTGTAAAPVWTKVGTQT